MKVRDPRTIVRRTGMALRSSKGKNILLYLMFVAVAFCFWLMLSLDSEVQRDFEVPLEITDIPDSVTIITDVPAAVNVSVKARGVQLLRFSWGDMPVLKLDWRNYVGKSERNFSVVRARLEARVREYFGNGVSIISVRPESLSLEYTTKPGHPVRVKLVVDVTPSIQCIINGAIRANVDSVMAYSNQDIPRSFTTVETEPLIKSGLKDTATYTVRLKPVKGIRLIPDRIKVMVPVEPLISKKRSVEVDVLNVPSGLRVITFPSKVEVTYLVPMSAYNDDFPMKGYVEYEDTEQVGDKLAVKLGLVPENYHNISLSPDSVEYLIERIGR